MQQDEAACAGPDALDFVREQSLDVVAFTEWSRHLCLPWMVMLVLSGQ